MKRLWVFCIFIFLVENVLAVQGVSPGSYEVFYEGGLKEDFVFNFVLDGKGELEIEGELKDYVFLDKEEIWDKESVVVSLKLPEGLDRVGPSSIWIIADSVRGLIKVNFPYPDKYLGLTLAAPNVNVGEEVLINLKAFNFGVEDLNVSPDIEIYLGDELIDIFKGEEKRVLVSEGVDYVFSFDSENYSAGDYLIVARSGDFIGKGYFRLGEKRLRILNYTRRVDSDGVEKFEIEVENLWNDRLNEVYAKVRVVGGDGGFDTSIVSLNSWEKKNLVGYFYTHDIEGEIKLSIDVVYDGEIESEVVFVEVDKGFSWLWFGFFVWIIVVVVLIKYRKFFQSK